MSSQAFKHSSSHSTASASLEACLPQGSVKSRSAVAFSVLSERSRARAPYPRPWAQITQGTSRSRAQTAAPTLIPKPPPPHSLVSSRTRASRSSTSAGDTPLSRIPVAKFSGQQARAAQRPRLSLSSTVSTRNISERSETGRSALAITPSASASDDDSSSTCSSASSAAGSSASSTTSAAGSSASSAAGSSATTVSSGSSGSSGSGSGSSSGSGSLDLDRCSTTAHTLSSASSEDSTVSTWLAQSLESLSLTKDDQPTTGRSATSEHISKGEQQASLGIPRAKGSRIPCRQHSFRSSTTTRQSSWATLSLQGQVRARLRAEWNAAEVSMAAAADDRTPVSSRPPIARRDLHLHPSATLDKPSSAPTLPQPAPKSCLRKPGSVRPVKGLRWEPDARGRWNSVKVTVYTTERWITPEDQHEEPQHFMQDEGEEEFF